MRDSLTRNLIYQRNTKIVKNIIIFGHSVDPLDKEIFANCFKLVDNKYYQSRFIFTYFNETAKRSIIKNLSHYSRQR